MKRLIWLLCLFPLLVGCTENVAQIKEDAQSKREQTTNITLDEISNWTYRSGDNPVKKINHDKPTSIDSIDFKKSHIDYGGLDKLNRTKRVTAYLTRNNLGHSNTRTEQTWRPTGWHNQPKYIKGRRVIPQNRGHLIAYTLTFNLDRFGNPSQGKFGSLDNPYNLFTQSEFSNQKTMTQVEQIIRHSLTKNKKVIYQVTPVFRGHELMARGVWVQALATDGSMKINRYLWNVQNNLQFNYATGYSTIDSNFKVPIINSPHYKYQHRYYHKVIR